MGPSKTNLNESISFVQLYTDTIQVKHSATLVETKPNILYTLLFCVLFIIEEVFSGFTSAVKVIQ